MWWLYAIGCGGDDGTHSDPDPTDTDDTEVAHSAVTSGASGLTGSTATTATTAETAHSASGTVFDCDSIAPPTAYDPEIPGPRGYHGLAVDDLGNMYGYDSSNVLVKSDAYGNVTRLVFGLGGGDQMVFLPDGTLAATSFNQGVVKIDVNTGGYTTLASLQAYGLVLDRDGMLWAAEQYADRITKIDPATGDTEVMLPRGMLAQGSPRVINFNLDYTKLFIGTYSGSQGRIYELPLDATLYPTALPTVYANGVGNGSYHDTMSVDICGYLYVADYVQSKLFRIHPINGTHVVLHDPPNLDNYGHGMTFGRGYGGFSDMAVYQSQPYDANKVSEMMVNVPPRGWEFGTAIHIPY